MRKVTNNAVNAFMQGKPFAQGNTTVFDYGWYTSLLLHGNKIAELVYQDGKKTLMIRNAGWFSNTTKERLNGVLHNTNYYIYQKNFQWFIASVNDREGKVWDGEAHYIELN